MPKTIEQVCCEHYHNTGKIPPVNLFTWVSCYNLVMNKSMSELGTVIAK